MNKASGGDGIPVELFQILKDDAVNVLYSICQQIWKSQQWPQDWKRSVFIPVLKKTNAKECSNYHTLALISSASKVILNFSKQSLRVHEPRTSRCSSWTYKRQRNQRSNCQHLLDHRKSKSAPEKKSTSVFFTMPKSLTVWITTNCGKFFKRWEYQTILPASLEICMQVKKQQLEPDMEQQTGSNLGKENV